MELLTILAQYKVIRDALKAGEYVGAWRATLPVQESMCTLAESVGFKSNAKEAKTRTEIEAIAGECCELCETASATHEGMTGAFDWKTALMKILAALFEAWKPNS